MKYIIYLDTKIEGALYQTINYFDNEIFGKETLLVYKKYKQIDKLFQKELKKANIHYKSFLRYKDLPSMDGKIVFYLFNAQSNCRIVANRNAKHIFVTHGESNKVSSVKPIIRIYDYVIVSGDLGIDRYLENKIFHIDDIKRDKVIKMGTTFIGNAKYNYDENTRTILYAPTWEGGIIEENYSSLNKDLFSFKILHKYSTDNDIKTIIIQPHPNTGHRDKAFLLYLIDGINYLLNNNYNIIINFKFHWFTKLKLIKNKKLYINKKFDDLSVSKAFVDVSAMEIQLMAKNIPTYVFFNETVNTMPVSTKLQEHYKKCAIRNFNYTKNLNIDIMLKNYCISYKNEKIESLNFKQRIEWLSDFVLENKSI